MPFILRGKDILFREKEILCTLDLPLEGLSEEELKIYAAVKERQRQIADEVANSYQNGDENAARNLKKARQYRYIAHPELEKEEAEYYSKNFSRWLSKYFDQETVYFITDIYNSSRLFIMRLDLLSGFFGKSFLPRLFSIGGFYYAGLFLFDLSKVLYGTFREPATEVEANLTHWQRFKNNITEEGRPSRMINAALWFSINFTAFILSGGLAIALNVAGFTFDIFHAVARSVYDVYKHKKLLTNVVEEIEEKSLLIAAAKAQGNIKLANELHQEVKQLNLLKFSLEQKTEQVVNKAIKNVALTTMFVVGIALTLFPPTMIVGVVLVAASVVLTVKDAFDGLASKLASGFMSWARRKKSAIKIENPSEKAIGLGPTLEKGVTQEAKVAVPSQSSSYKNQLGRLTENVPAAPQPLLKSYSAPNLGGVATHQDPIYPVPVGKVSPLNLFSRPGARDIVMEEYKPKNTSQHSSPNI